MMFDIRKNKTGVRLTATDACLYIKLCVSCYLILSAERTSASSANIAFLAIKYRIIDIAGNTVVNDGVKSCDMSFIVNSITAKTVYHPKHNRMLNMQYLPCAILLRYVKIAINDMGHVMSCMANKAHTEKSWLPSGRDIQRLYIVDFSPIVSPDMKFPNGKHRHTIVKISASSKNNVCLRCIITCLFDCPSACHANRCCRL